MQTIPRPADCGRGGRSRAREGPSTTAAAGHGVRTGQARTASADDWVVDPSSDRPARWTREDLIQVEYDLYSHMLSEAERKRHDDPVYMSSRFLEIDVADVLLLNTSVPMIDADAVRLELGRQLAVLPRDAVSAPRFDEPVTWAEVRLGAERVRVPEYLGLRAPAGSLAPVPLVVRSWPRPNQLDYFVQVCARESDREEAESYVENLRASASDERSPHRRRILEIGTGRFGLEVTVVALEAIAREDLVLGDDVWEAIRRNVDRMFDRMDRLAAAGLGTNRGLVLSGPPGTGKSALCRALAHEYDGKVTVAIISASAGQYLLKNTYEHLDRLAPALVLVEDLDLLVGDRDHHERGPLVEFLTVLDGLMTHHGGVVTVATTNDAKMIDDAAIRAARFDQVVPLALPDAGQRRDILGVYLRSVSHEADLDALARRADGLSGADLREVVRSAVLDAEANVVSHDELSASLERRRAFVDRLPVGFVA